MLAFGNCVCYSFLNHREKYWEYEYEEVVSPNLFNFDLWVSNAATWTCSQHLESIWNPTWRGPCCLMHVAWCWAWCSCDSVTPPSFHVTPHMERSTGQDACVGSCVIALAVSCTSKAQLQPQLRMMSPCCASGTWQPPVLCVAWSLRSSHYIACHFTMALITMPYR